jgi:ribonuclease P/MRP protein subunit POP1
MQSAAMDETQNTESSGIKETALPTDSKPDTLPPLGIEHLRLDARAASQLNANTRIWKFLKDKPYLATVRVTLFGRGTPTRCARIYRLPLKNDGLRKQWLSTKPSPSKSGSSTKAGQVRPLAKTKPSPIDSETKRKEDLGNPEPSTPELTSEIPLPLEDDLIGFISSGNYNLTEGKGTGIGSILISKVVESSPTKDTQSKSQSTKKGACSERRVCIVRSAGERVGRLGLWEFV